MLNEPKKRAIEKLTIGKQYHCWKLTISC